MRKALFCIVVFLFGVSEVYSQHKDSVDYGDINLSAGMVMGRDFCGEPFYMDNVSLDYAKWVSPKVGLRLGAELGNVSSHLLDNCEDKAPYSRTHRRTAAYVGFDYLASPKMLVSVTVFFDNLSLNGFNPHLGASQLYTNGINANFTYKFSNESSLKLSLTFVESNNPMMFCHPMSMRYNPYMFAFPTSFWQP